MESRNVTVTITEMIIQTQRLIKKEGIKGLKGGRGYVEAVMKRNNIGSQMKHGEAMTVNQAMVDDWIPKLRHLVKEYRSDDVFNADELGLILLHSMMMSLQLIQLIMMTTKTVIN